MNDIMEILQGISLKGVTKTIKNETKEQKGGFLSMLLGTLGASLLGDKKFIRKRNCENRGTNCKSRRRNKKAA